MSASEMLRALMEKPVLNMFKIHDAMPLIADCIEAEEIGWKAHDVPNCEYCGAPTLDARSKILGALTALTKHLEGGRRMSAAEHAICPTCGEPASAGFKNAEGECSDAIHHAAFSASNECRADEGWHYFEDGLKVCRCGRLVARVEHLEGQ